MTHCSCYILCLLKTKCNHCLPNLFFQSVTKLSLYLHKTEFDRCRTKHNKIKTFTNETL